MYGRSSDGEGHDASGAPSRKIPPASSMLWVRNLRHYIRSGVGLGSEALMGLETKRILLDIFKEKQQKSAEAGTIPNFYKKKQSDLLLNANDLDAMWVCLRENFVIDDATRAEKMNYEDFCHIASVCTKQVGPKCLRYFSPSNGFLEKVMSSAYCKGIIKGSSWFFWWCFDDFPFCLLIIFYAILLLFSSSRV